MTEKRVAFFIYPCSMVGRVTMHEPGKEPGDIIIRFLCLAV
jgi:hypothetical protein